MLVKTKSRESHVEVYGIYWVIPYEGFVALGEKESIVIAPRVQADFVLRKNDEIEDFLLHWAADKGDLIYNLVESDPKEMVES